MCDYIPDVCRGCNRLDETGCCKLNGCAKWREQYLYRQAMINGYAIAHNIKPTTPPEETEGDINHE